MRHHLLIAGTGRAGTSLLVRILDACGLETQLRGRFGDIGWDESAQAGLESIPVLGENQPYVVKSPWSYQFIDELLRRPDLKLDCVFLPIRNLAEATASRITLELQHRYQTWEAATELHESWREWGVVPGGLTYSLEPIDQSRLLAHSLHRMIEALVRHDVPIKFLYFPKFADDLEYLYRCLKGALPTELSFSEFQRRVVPVINLQKIRAGCELRAEIEVVSDCHPDRFVESEGLPSFGTIDNISLKRELKSLRNDLIRITGERDKLIAAEQQRLRRSFKQVIVRRLRKIAKLSDRLRECVLSSK
ncbi:hypothetical protein [Hyphomicrobium sp. MC1]|uniref:hypothetical protein n=1 Tax=Hyphomicrobium sp. (strain MC1) TaxID=717785 RepID=UPI000213D5B9|nr:hypothetical protein [Hyphomicrobium sp. MC1]CCB65033.1 conserved protein of unknown function [Hyphomicrobium sp. MC1]